MINYEMMLCNIICSKYVILLIYNNSVIFVISVKYVDLNLLIQSLNVVWWNWLEVVGLKMLTNNIKFYFWNTLVIYVSLTKCQQHDKKLKHQNVCFLSNQCACVGFVSEVHSLSKTMCGYWIVIENGSIKIPNTNTFQIMGSVNMSMVVASKCTNRNFDRD